MITFLGDISLHNIEDNNSIKSSKINCILYKDGGLSVKIFFDITILDKVKAFSRLERMYEIFNEKTELTHINNYKFNVELFELINNKSIKTLKLIGGLCEELFEGSIDEQLLPYITIYFDHFIIENNDSKIGYNLLKLYNKLFDEQYKRIQHLIYVKECQCPICKQSLPENNIIIQL